MMSTSFGVDDLVSTPGPSTSNDTQSMSELTLIDYFVVAGYDPAFGLQVSCSVLLLELFFFKLL